MQSLLKLSSHQNLNYSVLISPYISSHKSEMCSKIIIVVRLLKIEYLDHIEQFIYNEVVYTENLREWGVGLVMFIFLRANESD